jgi:hypothetical protein
VRLKAYGRPAEVSQSERGGRVVRGPGVAGSVVESRTAFQQQIAEADGGGIYSSEGSVTLVGGSIIQDNIADGAFGMGAFTLAHTINNKDRSGSNGSTANINGKYTLLS